MIQLVGSLTICKICRRSLWTSRYLLCEADYHKVLGVSKNITKKELKKRFVELSKQYHPDVVAGKLSEDDAKEQFQKINEAYRKLMKKFSKPKRVLVETRGYKPKSDEEIIKTKDQAESSSFKFEQSSNPEKVQLSSQPSFSNTHGLNLLFFMFVATLTVKIALKEDGLLSTRPIVVDENIDPVSQEIARKKNARDNNLYFLLGLPMLLIYWRYWNRFGRG